MQLGDVHSEAAVGGQGFARQFEQHSFIHSSKVSHIQDRSLSLGLGATCAVYSTQIEAFETHRRGRFGRLRKKDDLYKWEKEERTSGPRFAELTYGLKPIPTQRKRAGIIP